MDFARLRDRRVARYTLGGLGNRLMFDRLGSVVSRHWPIVVIAWLVLAVALHRVAPRWNDITHDGDLAYLPDSLPSVEGERLLREAFPEDRSKSEFVIVVERPGGPLTTADLLWSDGLAEQFRARTDLPIVDVLNRNTDVIGDKLVSRLSKAGQAAVTLLRSQNEFMAVGNMNLLKAVQAQVEKAREQAPAGLQVGLTGSAAVGGDMLLSAAESIQNTEWTTIALVIVILLVVYRAPLLVSIPLITIGVSLVVATDALALLTQLHRVPGFAWWNFKVFTTTRIFIVVILFGAGTDFCLFLISRYREELQRGMDRVPAVAESVGRVGEALVASAMTTICGLGMMFFAAFGKFRNSGPAIALCLAITLIACLTLAPALLSAFGRFVFWPFDRRMRPGAEKVAATDVAEGQSRFWEATSRVIMARPGMILLLSVVLLAPFAYRGLSIQLTYDLLNELSRDRTSVLGAEVARRHFSPGEMGPLTVLALKPHAEFNQAEGERLIAQLTKQLYEIDGIKSVRSMAEPTGDPPGYFQPFRGSGLKKLAARRHKQTKATYLTQVPELSGDVARFDLLLKYDPFSPEAIGVLNEVDAFLRQQTDGPDAPWQGTKFTFVGTTAGIRDLAAVTASDQQLIEWLVVLAVLAVLIVLLRRPVICLYLILSVLFSYLVTIGITQIFFNWSYGDTYRGLDWKVPIFLFVILIAVGEDYNIYLVTRVVEEQRRHGAAEGLRRAIARTGGIITSCGVIMAGTFVSMTTGTLRGVVELGFALSLGVMLDTCVVRPILVPAFLALAQRYRPPENPSVTPPVVASAEA